MIVGDELGRWFADRERQAATVAEIEESGCAWRESDACRTLHADLARTCEGDAAAVLAAASRFAGAAGDLETMLAGIVRAARANPFYRPPFKVVSSPVHSGLILFEHPLLTLLLAVTPPHALAAKRTFARGGASITLAGQQSLFRFIRSGGAVLSFWEAPEIGPAFTAASSGRCRRTGTRRVEDGEEIFVDGRRETFIIEHAVSDIVYTQAVTSVGSAPVSVEYDSATHAFAGASSNEETSSRIQMMLTLLRTLDRREAAPLFEDMLEHAHFYLRWHAMREFLALDAAAALPGLRRMAARDPHPEVRAAAQETLRAFFSQAESEDALCPA